MPFIVGQSSGALNNTSIQLEVYYLTSSNLGQIYQDFFLSGFYSPLNLNALSDDGNDKKEWLMN